jgi:uncharacterized protein
MVVGVVTWRMQLPAAGSLKEKRSVVKGVKARLRNTLNVSVAETGLHDLLMSAQISACVVATDQVQAQSVLQAADDLMEEEWRIRLSGTETVYY